MAMQHPLQDNDTEGSVFVCFGNQDIRQRTQYGTMKDTLLVPQKREPEPPPRGPTISERWEAFTSTRKWKVARPFLRPTSILGYLVIFWLIYLLTDFQIVQDGEAYSPKTKCAYSLILFKDYVLQFRKVVAPVDLKNPDYAVLNDAMATSTCYLKNYAKNMSCITPIAYGQHLRIVSMRRKNGDILHLINPQNPTRLDKVAHIQEGSTLFPGAPLAVVGRPLGLTIEYVDETLKDIKKERFEYADAFCISSSLDLFERTLPQLGNAE